MSGSAHELLTALRSAHEQLEGLRRYDQALAVCAAGLARMQAVLARTPRVVILGEVNSGKTSVADLLLGVGLLPSSVVANTRLPVLIRYAEETALHAVAGDKRWLVTGESLDAPSAGRELTALEIALPSERLKEFEILDTPALSDWNGANTDGDIRIWCTVATRAWTESERVYWSGLPRRNWRNALLVATHKDALEEASDAAKIEWRLRAAAGEMFRDIVLVAAADAGKSRGANVRLADTSAITLLGQVRVWAREIRERRAHKVEKIVRRLARLTFHQLARGTLRLTEARILREWEADCARLIGGIGNAPGDLANVTRELLRRFAQAMELAHSGSIGRQNHRPLAGTHSGEAGAPQRGLPARRFAKLIAADLTTLLRIELARGGLRDPTLFADYDAARRILLPLARLDLEFDMVESLLASGRPREAAVPAPSIEQVLASLARAR